VCVFHVCVCGVCVCCVGVPLLIFSMLHYKVIPLVLQ